MFKASSEYCAIFGKQEFGAREDLRGLRDMRGDIQSALNLVQRRKVQHFKVAEPLRDAEKALLNVLAGIGDVIAEKEEVAQQMKNIIHGDMREAKLNPLKEGTLGGHTPGLRELPFFDKR